MPGRRSISDSVRTVTAGVWYSSLAASASAVSGPAASMSRSSPVSRSITRSWVAASRRCSTTTNRPNTSHDTSRVPLALAITSCQPSSPAGRPGPGTGHRTSRNSAASSLVTR